VGFRVSLARSRVAAELKEVGDLATGEQVPHMSISLDGFVAGPAQSRENPLGVGGLELHHWHLDEPFHEADAHVRDELMTPCGAYVMGRNMFGPVRGPVGGQLARMVGDEPPYHAPVFVLTP
jgi:dihydrofolate reductase